MIIVTPKKSKKGIRLEVKNQNSHLFNHFYGKNTDAKRAWDNFVKQVKAGRVKFMD